MVERHGLEILPLDGTFHFSQKRTYVAHVIGGVGDINQPRHFIHYKLSTKVIALGTGLTIFFPAFTGKDDHLKPFYNLIPEI